MEILNRVAKRGLGLLLLLVSACLLVDRWWPTEPLFSHALHVEGEGLDCTMCHTTADSGPPAGMPSLESCLLCHDSIDAEQADPTKRVTAFFDGDGAYRATRRAAIPAEVKFSHGLHAEAAGLDCSACHGAIGESDHIPEESAVTKAECMSCHAERGLSNRCDECHQDIRATTPPASHGGLWPIQHGAVVRAHDERSVNNCSLCHSESSCQACHQENPPTNHTNYWRRRGHGITVAMDRSSCATCHKSDSCDRCHESTRPVSHRASFGSPRSSHCTGCHFPLSGEGCATCHKQAPSHLALAAPLPSNHTPGMNCRQCHGLSAPLPHPDKGDLCTACHR